MTLRRLWQALLCSISLSSGVATAQLNELWRSTQRLTAPPTALPDGVAICLEGEEGPALARLKRDGGVIWEVPLAGRCVTPPVADEDAIYARVHGVGVVALSRDDGATLWTAKPSGRFASSADEPWLEDGRWYAFSRVGDLLFAAERLKLYAISPESGAILWKNGAYNIGESMIFEADTPSGFAVLNAGSPSPFTGLSSSSVWGSGDVYALQPDQDHVQRTTSGADVSRATGAASVTIASAPVRVGEQIWVLVQRFGEVPENTIRHTPEGQAIGGSREPAKASGVSLAQMGEGGAIIRAFDVTSESSHQTLALGRRSHPMSALGVAGEHLVFSTADADEGASIVLQARANDGTLRWKKEGLMLLATQAERVIAAALTGKDAGALVVLSADGDELGRVAMELHPDTLLAPVTTSDDRIYLVSPERMLIALSLSP